eukprot:Opistho-2@77589
MPRQAAVAARAGIAETTTPRRSARLATPSRDSVVYTAASHVKSASRGIASDSYPSAPHYETRSRGSSYEAPSLATTAATETTAARSRVTRSHDSPHNDDPKESFNVRRLRQWINSSFTAATGGDSVSEAGESALYGLDSGDEGDAHSHRSHTSPLHGRQVQPRQSPLVAFQLFFAAIFSVFRRATHAAVGGLSGGFTNVNSRVGASARSSFSRVRNSVDSAAAFASQRFLSGARAASGWKHFRLLVGVGAIAVVIALAVPQLPHLLPERAAVVDSDATVSVPAHSEPATPQSTTGSASVPSSFDTAVARDLNECIARLESTILALRHDSKTTVTLRQDVDDLIKATEAKSVAIESVRDAVDAESARLTKHETHAAKVASTAAEASSRHAQQLHDLAIELKKLSDYVGGADAAFAAKVDRIEGALGALVNRDQVDRQVAERISTTLKELRLSEGARQFVSRADFEAHVERADGLVKALVKDDQLDNRVAENIKRTLRELKLDDGGRSAFVSRSEFQAALEALGAGVNGNDGSTDGTVSAVSASAVLAEIEQLRAQHAAAAESLNAGLDAIEKMRSRQRQLEFELESLNDVASQHQQQQHDATAADVNRIAERVVLLLQQRGLLADVGASRDGEESGSVAPDQIYAMIQSAIDLYDADRVGMVDHALVSAGAKVLRHCTGSTFAPAWLSILGVHFTRATTTPEMALSVDTTPGNCWAMNGQNGNLTIHLAHTIVPTMFTIDHVPSVLNTNVASTPKDFRVWGLANDCAQDGIFLGAFGFNISGPSRQQFHVESAHARAVNVIRLEILNNYGDDRFTCLYRFRVHGDITEPIPDVDTTHAHADAEETVESVAPVDGESESEGIHSESGDASSTAHADDDVAV